MATISEKEIENRFIKQLQNYGYEKVEVHDERSFLNNFRKQLEKHNGISFTDQEFERILIHLNSGTIFDKAKKLRDKFELQRDNGSIRYIEFFNMSDWCKNEYQIAHQIRMHGKYTNIYDVTLLVNGLPLVHIELKKAGVEISEAFRQIRRYSEHSFKNTLFEYIQIFVISNKANTKYFANNDIKKFEHTFYWSDENNRKITNLAEFSEAFLKPCFISKIIARNIVLSEARKSLMILRPYQHYAVEKIVKKVGHGSGNGYIWHTTGSGKTLTSYKTAQILSSMPEIEKVIFIVDRRDLDIQTVEEFNSFSNGSVNATNNTRQLAWQLQDPKRKLVVTTIQKLDRALKKEFHRKRFLHLQKRKTVLIFDECHRGHFGKTNAAIRKFFKNASLIDFTGTPIFKENAKDGTTTADIFGESLHRYVITDAIKDGNVLGFSIEYFSDPLGDAGDFENKKRIEEIAKHILSIHDKKTAKRKFNAIFATPSTKIAYEYYKTLQRFNKDLNIALIFTFPANGEIESVDEDEGTEKFARDNLESAIRDYNETFGTNFSTDTFGQYYEDVQKRVKNGGIDIVIVVGMMLTGFDAPTLNTLYVDKNLEYHNLIQAYSRTNRIFDSSKPHGNIVCFRNLKENTDKALLLYENAEAQDIVFKKPYKEQLEEFENVFEKLHSIASSPNSVDEIASEETQREFVKAFREILKKKTSMETFSEFSWEDLPIDEETFNEYKSKYLDLYERSRKIKDENEAESPLTDIDFELELIGEDYINYDYIIRLLSIIKSKNGSKDYEKTKESFLKKFDQNIKLRPKKAIVEKFINEKLQYVETEDVEKVFDEFWEEEKKRYLEHIRDFYQLDPEKFEEIVFDYIYKGELPKSRDIRQLFTEATRQLYKNAENSIEKRDAIVQSVKESLVQYYEIFENF